MAATMDLIAVCRQSVGRFAEELQDALVYLDEGAGEAFHFMGGLPFFLQFGVRSVCSLENAHPFDSVNTWNVALEGPLHKLVVITSRFLSDAHRYIIHCLQVHHDIREVIIFSSLSEEAHAASPGTPLGTDAYAEYKNLLLQDFYVVSGIDAVQDQAFCSLKTQENVAAADVLQPEVSIEEHYALACQGSESEEMKGNQLNPNIQVLCMPLIICPLTPKVFVLPSAATIAEAPLLDCADYSMGPGLPGIDVGVPIDGEEHLPPGSILLAFLLQQLGSQLDLKFEIFTLGRLAKAVGKYMIELPNLPEGAGQTRRPAGLVIVDRSLDLITPICHGDSLVDQIFSCLPRRAQKHPIVHHPPAATALTLSVPVIHAPVDVWVPNKDFIYYDKQAEAHTMEYPLSILFPNWQENMCETRQRLPSDGNCGKDVLAGNFQGDAFNPFGGSVSCAWEFNGFDRLDLLFEKGTKDGATLIRKWLQEAIKQEKLDLPRKTRLGAVTLRELQSLVRVLTAFPKAAIHNMTLIQIAGAAIMALESSSSSRWEAFKSIEKVLMLTARETEESIVLQVRDLINHSLQHHPSSCSQEHAILAAQGRSLLSLRDSLIVTMLAYCLAGKWDLDSGSIESPFRWDEEQSLKEAVLGVILGSRQGLTLGFLKGLENPLESHWKKAECRNSLKGDPPAIVERNNEWADDQWEGWDETEEEGNEPEEFGEMQLKLEVRDRIEEVFKILHRVAAARNHFALSERLQQSPDDLNSFNTGFRLQKGLIHKIMSLIARKADVPGLEHHSSTVGRIFKSGLGRFGLGQVKPKASDQKILLIFIIGGFNAMEVREAREALASAPGGVELIFGGTTLLTADEMYNLTLGTTRSF